MRKPWIAALTAARTTALALALGLALGIIGLAGSLAPAAAQAAWPEDDPALVHDQLVVTGVLETEAASRLAGAIEIVDGEELEFRQATSIADGLRTAAGLDVVRSGSPGKVTSVFSRGTESDHVLVLWNGVELNNPYFGGFDWAFLPTEGVDRIELARGPYSALYGADALGGVVNVVSSAGDGGSLRLELGEDGYRRAALVAGGGGDKAGYQLSGHLLRSDGLEVNDFLDGAELAGRGFRDLAGGSSLALLVRVNDSDLGIPRSAGLPSPNRTVAWRESQVAVPWTWTRSRWSLRGEASRVELESSFRDPDDAFGFTASDTRSRVHRLRAQATRRFGHHGWLAAGVEREDAEVDDRSSFGVNLTDASRETRSVFAQALVELSGASLDLGVRHDDFDQFGSRWTPKVSLAWSAAGGRIWASYGEGFRAPSVGELLFPFSGNRELRPEDSTSYELGYRRRAGRWNASIATYENRLRDLIDFDLVAFRNVNVSRARTRGVEAGVGFESARTRFKLRASTLDAEDETTGLELLRRPETRASVVASRVLDRSTWTATGFYVGERPDVDPALFTRRRNPSYVRVDLAFEWRGRKRVTPYGRIENLFDETYQEALGFPAPGRSGSAGVRIGWGGS